MPCIIYIGCPHNLGNLARVPLLRSTNSSEPNWFWGLAIAVAALLLAISLVPGNRIVRDLPFLESRLRRKDIPA